MNTTSPTKDDTTTANRLLGLQSRLVIATLLLCSGLVTGTFWCAQHAAKNAARVQFDTVSETTLQLMHEATQSRILSLDQGIAAAVLDPVFRAQLSRLRQSDASFGLDDSGTTTELPIAEVHDVLSSAELPYFQRYDFFLIATNEKVLLLNRAQATTQGIPLTLSLLEQADKQATVAKFVAGNTATLHKLGADPTQLYLMIAKKIVVSGQSLGYIVVGESVNHGLLKELDRVSQAQSGIAANHALWFRDATAKAVATSFLQQTGLAKTDTPLSQPLLGTARTDFNWQGQEYFVKTAENGLILVKPISKDLALLTNELTRQFVFFIVPLSLLALFSAFAYAQFFAKPIVDLTEEVKKVKAGNYAAKMPVFRRDEVGELARAFNEMTESLSALRIDPLTGLYSEQYLKDTLAFELTYAVSHNKHLALVNLSTSLILKTPYSRWVKMKHAIYYNALLITYLANTNAPKMWLLAVTKTNSGY